MLAGAIGMGWLSLVVGGAINVMQYGTVGHDHTTAGASATPTH